MSKPWKEVLVDWSGEWNCWLVGAYDQGGNREHLGEAHYKSDAVEEAKIYAFDESCGPTRAEQLTILDKRNNIIKVITAA